MLAPGDLDDRRGKYLLRLAGSLWIALAVAVSVKCVVEPVAHSVYPCFEAAGRGWWTGTDIYDFSALQFHYRYSPVFAAAMGPLAALPAWLGGLLWSWLNLAAFSLALRALVRWVLPGRWSPQWEAVYLMLALLGSLRMIWSAQSNPLVFALIAGGFVAVAKQRWWWAAWLLAAAVYIKIWPVAAALLLAACWPRQLTWRLLVTLPALTAVPFLTAPPQWVVRQYEGWYALLLRDSISRHIYRDAWTVWELIRSPVNPLGYLALQLGTAAIVLGLVLWRRRQGGTSGLLGMVLALWTAWQMLFGPGMERNAFGLFAPLSAWGLTVALQQRRGRVWMVPAFALATLASFGALERAFSDALPVVLVAHPLGAMLFAVWMAVEYTTEARRTYRVTSTVKANPW